jgi:hypothetical protein
MKTLAMMAALVMLTGCAGTWVERKSVKYIVSAKHEALAQCVEARAKGYEAKMVVAQKGDETTAWCEVDGVPVMRLGMPRRLLPNPRWPMKMHVATKRGTPRELGLYGTKGDRAQTRLLLYTSEHKRLIGHYEACKALYDSATVATDGVHYWLEVVVDGKRYAETTRSGHLDHYDAQVAKGYTVAWKGSLEEYEELAASSVRTPEQIAANRADAHDSIKSIPVQYWTSK